MKEKDIPELIEDFLLGHIQTSDLARLENLRRANPDIDLQVLQSIEAFRVLQYARNQQLRQKLRQIDINETYRSGGNRLTALHITVIVFSVSIVSLWIWAMQYFSPASLAVRYFEPSSPAFLENLGVSKEEVHNWESACEAMIKKDFQSARLLFQPFIQNQNNSIAQYAQWNYLLARMASEGPSPGLMEEIRQFETVAPDPVKKKNSSVIRIVDSPFYQIIVIGLFQQLSALKPKLM